ncbi:carbonic anhydrase [Micavibrio aeruginosavorus]|uniref:carbonic anhydrase n=1 Tax=Micavibrio aeruginosavorus (strain ARL-13) TaxID=856793 RepID=G2KMP9_MICAA|nr:carbonic anhydrase [Micavibrio aeruginosavorus]AEP08436.1 carbonic anhydrase family protein [Micavibrio aeruginosavorus ARL-13]
MDQLIAGYRRFRETGWPERKRIFRQLAERGQKPRALIVSCVDSRVDPTMIFDCGPGEILIVRNVANLVPPYAPDTAYHGTSAALEFGIRVLEIPHLIVLGHGMCGGVSALLNGAPAHAQDFVAPWMQIAESARIKTTDIPDATERQTCCEHEVIKVSLENLMTFPWIAERVTQGTLSLHGAWYAIESGVLETLQADGTFQPVA